MQHWGPERTVRAEVLVALLLGANATQVGAVPALRLTGARITGRLDLGGAEVTHGLWLEHCCVAEEVSLYGAATRTVSITSSCLRGLDGSMARMNGRLDLRNSAIEGTLGLKNAHIAGELLLEGAVITRPGEWAFDAGGLVMEGGIWARKGFTVYGGTRMPGATLPGGLFFNEARLHNPDGIAFRAENATAATMVFTQGFTAHGAIQLQGVQVTGPLTFAGARLGPPQTTLDCTRLQANALDFTPAAPPSGAVDLQGARVEVLNDHPASWPGVVKMQGFTYGSLQTQHSVVQRISWIQREAAYAPQPYEQLATWYRKIGHEGDARRVLLAKQRHRRGTLSPAGRAWSHLLDATVGFGYRLWLAAVWLVALAALGTSVFSSNSPHSTQTEARAPFSPLIYTLDLLIPVGGLGQRAAWYWDDGTARWVSYALIAAGWLLTTAVVTGVTRSLNKT
uniref:Membrane-associated oxidoreductase n=1 Tax=Streptomyces auratus AGR0001 TaxID=1160718 RepID=J2JR89_9ACTN